MNSFTTTYHKTKLRQKNTHWDVLKWHERKYLSFNFQDWILSGAIIIISNAISPAKNTPKMLVLKVVKLFHIRETASKLKKKKSALTVSVPDKGSSYYLNRIKIIQAISLKVNFTYTKEFLTTPSSIFLALSWRGAIPIETNITRKQADSVVIF